MLNDEQQEEDNGSKEEEETKSRGKSFFYAVFILGIGLSGFYILRSRRRETMRSQSHIIGHQDMKFSNDGSFNPHLNELAFENDLI